MEPSRKFQRKKTLKNKVTRRLSTANRWRVSIRVSKCLARAGGGHPCKIIHAPSVVAVKKLVTVSHTVYACKGPKILGTLAPRPFRMGVVNP